MTKYIAYVAFCTASSYIFFLFYTSLYPLPVLFYIFPAFFQFFLVFSSYSCFYMCNPFLQFFPTAFFRPFLYFFRFLPLFPLYPLPSLPSFLSISVYETHLVQNLLQCFYPFFHSCTTIRLKINFFYFFWHILFPYIFFYFIPKLFLIFAMIKPAKIYHIFMPLSVSPSCTYNLYKLHNLLIVCMSLKTLYIPFFSWNCRAAWSSFVST